MDLNSDQSDNTSLLSDAAARTQMMQAAASTMQAAGIYTQQAPGTKYVGTNNAGKDVFSSQSPNPNDYSSGAQAVGYTSHVLDSLGVLGDSEKEHMSTIAQNSTDPKTLSNLANLSQANDRLGFIDQVQTAANAPSRADSLKSKDQQGLNSLASASHLYDNWGQMNAAQQSVGLAHVGVQNLTFGDGTTIDSKHVVAPTDKAPGITVADSLKMMGQGINAPGLLQNYTPISNASVIATGDYSPTATASMAKQLNAAGFGSSGAAVPSVTADSLAKSGWSSSPQYGVGAVLGNKTSQMPKGYSKVFTSQQGGTIAVPKRNMSSAAGALQNGLVGSAAGSSGLSDSAHGIYQRWQPTNVDPGRDSQNSFSATKAPPAAPAASTSSNPLKGINSGSFGSQFKDMITPAKDIVTGKADSYDWGYGVGATIGGIASGGSPGAINLGGKIGGGAFKDIDKLF